MVVSRTSHSVKVTLEHWLKKKLVQDRRTNGRLAIYTVRTWEPHASYTVCQRTDLTQHGAVVEVERPHTAVTESRDQAPQRAVETHRCDGHRKFRAVGQDAHARHELDHVFTGVGVPYRDDRRFVAAHCIQRQLMTHHLTVKFFISHNANRPAMISVCSALSQTPVYTDRARIRG